MIYPKLQFTLQFVSNLTKVLKIMIDTLNNHYYFCGQKKIYHFIYSMKLRPQKKNISTLTVDLYLIFNSSLSFWCWLLSLKNDCYMIRCWPCQEQKCYLTEAKRFLLLINSGQTKNSPNHLHPDCWWKPLIFNPNKLHHWLCLFSASSSSSYREIRSKNFGLFFFFLQMFNLKLP